MLSPQPAGSDDSDDGSVAGDNLIDNEVIDRDA